MQIKPLQIWFSTTAHMGPSASMCPVKNQPLTITHSEYSEGPSHTTSNFVLVTGAVKLLNATH